MSLRERKHLFWRNVDFRVNCLLLLWMSLALKFLSFERLGDFILRVELVRVTRSYRDTFRELGCTNLGSKT